MKKHSFYLPFTLFILSSGLMGCAATIQTPYQAPSVEIPSQFQNAKASDKKLSLDEYQDQWWTQFNDVELNHLVATVIEKNPDLAVAGLNIKQAFLQAGLSENQQGLRANASTSAGHRIDLHEGESTSQGFSLSGGISYEVDLFGKLANQTQANRWEAVATQEDLEATAQTLIATTLKLYWKLAYLNESLTTAQKSLDSSQKLQRLVQIQYKAGAVSGLEMTQAAQAVQSQKSNLSQIQQQLVETRTGLATLLNIPVQQLNIQEPQKLNRVALPQINAGLPASLLARRPDLKAAEFRLRKVLANADATRASYYPSLSLTSNLGASSTSLIQLLKNPILTLGANLSLPFLQYNDMQKNIAISQVNYEKAIIQYRQSLYKAFAEVENALSARQELDKQVLAQQQTVQLAQKAEKLIQIQYRYGDVPLKNVIDQQETTRAAELTLVNIKQSQYNAYVTLMQTLGGSPIH